MQLPTILEAISHMSAIEILVDEHRLISRVVNVLSVLNKRLVSDDHVDVSVLNDVIDFLQMFVDKNHHAKEEDALFPILVRYAINPEGCTIQSLKSEHEKARALTTTLNDEIGKYKTGDLTAKSRICPTIRSLIELYNDHIWREDILLFPTAQRALQESELNDVTRNYEQIETRLGTDFRSKYVQLVNALEKTTDEGHGAT